MVGIDFNLPLNCGQYIFMDLPKGLANAYRTDCFLTTDRLSSQETIRQMRSQIRRQSSNKNFLLFRSIPVYGFCPDNISPVSSRHRSLPARHADKALSLRHSRKRVTQYVGKCERISGLENIRRLRAGFNKQSPSALRQRRLRHPTESRSLCSGFNNHRFMYVTVSMGQISQTQSRGQGTHADGLKRLYTHVYPHYRRESPRCQYPRQSCFRTRCHLRHGSRIPRFRSPFYLYSKPFNFCYKSQNQFRLSPSLLLQCRQNNRSSVRPDDNTQRFLCIAGLSCRSSSNRLLRCRDEQKVHISNEQLYAAGLDNRSDLQVPLADRNLFQVDQAISANQDVLRNFRECRQDSNLDSHQRLRFGGDRQERAENRADFGRNLANSQHCTFRESPYYTSTYENYVAKWKCPVS